MYCMTLLVQERTPRRVTETFAFDNLVAFTMLCWFVLYFWRYSPVPMQSSRVGDKPYLLLRRTRAGACKLWLKLKVRHLW